MQSGHQRPRCRAAATQRICIMGRPIWPIDEIGEEQKTDRDCKRESSAVYQLPDSDNAVLEDSRRLQEVD